MTARTRSRVLADFERYAFGVLRGTRVTTDDGALANRVLGPGMQEVSERAAPLRATPEARVLRCFVDAHADQMDRCVRESAPLGPARGRVAVWVRHRAAGRAYGHRRRRATRRLGGGRTRVGVMSHGFGDETAEVALVLAQRPGGRATAAELAERLGRPLAVVSRALREGERRGVVGSTITLSAQPGRDRVFWLTAEEGIRLVEQTERGPGAYG